MKRIIVIGWMMVVFGLLVGIFIGGCEKTAETDEQQDDIEIEGSESIVHVEPEERQLLSLDRSELFIARGKREEIYASVYSTLEDDVEFWIESKCLFEGQKSMLPFNAPRKEVRGGKGGLFIVQFSTDGSTLKGGYSCRISAMTGDGEYASVPLMVVVE